MASCKEGDRVAITTDDGIYEGILMPRPELLPKGFRVLKLDSGYNIGIDEKRIRKTDLLEAYAPKAQRRAARPPRKGLPTVAILSTGGTIASRIDYRTGGVSADYTADDYLAMLPYLADIANIRARKVMELMSEDMLPADWQAMARAIKKELDAGADGVVLTVGTDTLHFVSAALSFFLKGLERPVVITAAQRSIDRGSSDAFMNLACASTAAAKADIAGVVTCLHGTTDDEYCLLIRGTKARKMHTSRRDAFRPVNDTPVARVYESGRIEMLRKDLPKRGKGTCETDDAFFEKTALVQVYPGMDPKVIDFYVDAGYRGIVLAATALGHVPTNGKKSIIPNLARAQEKGIAIVVASQTLYGRVHPYVYTNLRRLSVELGCLFVEDMLPETAYIKLGWVLGHAKRPEDVKRMMLEDVAGEITERSEEGTFLS
ncbi:Glu-tRNA(Gln) amidotransferase subunit GatD [Candidatus Woesearchaeota archaeon]|nr:Glu-tRNA(Gln) amidotransferase subunit GatD [Candidatus Woesearchaeota archaeon]